MAYLARIFFDSFWMSYTIMPEFSVIVFGCKVALLSGENYFAVSYKGDIDGWRQQVEQGAAELGLLVAKISQDKFLLDSGDEVLLSECKFQFD